MHSNNNNNTICKEKTQLILCLITTFLSLALYIPLLIGLFNWSLRCLPILLFLICIGVIITTAIIISIIWLARYRRKLTNTKINSAFHLDHPLFPTADDTKYNYNNNDILNPYGPISGGISNNNNNTTMPQNNYFNNNNNNNSNNRSSSSRCCCTATSCMKLLQIITLTLTFIILLFCTSAYAYFSDGRHGPVNGFTDGSLSSKVHIQLSEKNVLHINAKTRNDAMFAQGLLTAEMRLWQMELQRRLGQGRLSEFVGPLALPTDKLMRTLGFFEKTIQDIKALDTEAYEALESYVNGVNAYINRKPTLPLEMQLLGYQRMAPWTMADSLVWSKIMSYDLSGNLKFEIQRFNLLLKGLSLDRIDELLPKFNTSHFPTVLTMEDIKDGKVPIGKLDAVSLFTDEKLKLFYKELQGKVDKKKIEMRMSKTKEESIIDLDDETSNNNNDGKNANIASAKPSFLSSIINSKLGLKLNSGLYGNLFSTKGASNNWVVGSKLSKTNKPLLCNDPHLQLTAPSIWIMTHINIEELKEDLWGASFVGLPGVSIVVWDIYIYM